MTTLPEKLVVIHEHLDDADLPHAFGGAIALAYCTEDPRGTIDIDVNVFVAPDDLDAVEAALPPDITWTDDDRHAVERDGQVRVWWDETPVDLFFSYHPFHDAAATRTTLVPFATTEIPVLSCTDLAVFKTFFARTRDFADIESMVDAGSVDGAEATRLVTDLLGGDHDNVRRLAAALEGTATPGRPSDTEAR